MNIFHLNNFGKDYKSLCFIANFMFIIIVNNAAK